MKNKQSNNSKSTFISKPLFMQSLKSNWLIWLAMTLVTTLVLVIILIALGSAPLFPEMNIRAVSQYLDDENLTWFEVLGFLSKMGFTLTRIETMSSIDLNNAISDLVYKVIAILVPMIYVILTSNALICSQVDNGSMAYILSTPTNRKTVVRTQYFYILLAVFAMYVFLTIGSLIGDYAGYELLKIGAPQSMHKIYPLRTFLYCFSSFLTMFALIGICFCASCVFNKTSYSVGVGGGIALISFICVLMGLFGSKPFVAAGIGVQSMSVFQYFSLYSLIDTESMSNFVKSFDESSETLISYSWIYKDLIALTIGVVTSIFGAIKFTKKDLPL